MDRVLITNGQLRKALTAVRGLAQLGADISVTEQTRLCPAAFSRYCNAMFVCPDPDKDEEKFHEWLIKTIYDKNISILFPMDDNTLSVVMKHREEYEIACKMLLPPTEGLEILNDKGKVTAAALKAGLDCPETYAPKSFEQARCYSKKINYPVLIKARFSSGSRGVRLVKSQEQFMEVYREIHSKFPWPVVQEFLGYGQSYDVNLIFNRDSELRGSFIYKHIRKFPPKMGPSVVQESVWNPELVEKSAAFLKALNWVGVADVEFLQDSRDGKMKFIEVNPRFWNALHASSVCGVNFAGLQYKIITQGDCKPVLNYSAGVLCRNIFPGDLFYFIFSKDRFNMRPPIFVKGAYDDVLSWEDPMPLLGFFAACFRYLADVNMWRFMLKR